MGEFEFKGFCEVFLHYLAGVVFRDGHFHDPEVSPLFLKEILDGG